MSEIAAPDDKFLQVQVPGATKRDLAIKAAGAGVPIRMLVLSALEAYGIDVPEGTIHDRRRGRP